MTGKVKCTCGWSWNKSDSSKKDMYICHECGRDNSNNMKNGGWLDTYANGGTMQEHQENYNNSETSFPEGFVGEGYNTKGRNYSPAWGGQFQMGGKLKSSIPVIEDAGNYNEEGRWVPDWKTMTAQAKKLGAKKVKTKHGSLIVFDDNWEVVGVDDNPDAMQTGGSIPGAVGFTYARTKGIPSNGPYAKKTMASAQDGGWLDGYEKAQGGKKIKIKDERSDAVKVSDNTYVKPLFTEANITKPLKREKEQRAKFNKLPKEQQERILYNQYAEQYGDIKPSQNQSADSKAWEVLTHPMTAAGYLARNENLPDHFSRGEINSHEQATNIINPFFYADEAKNFVSNTMDGKFTEAGFNALNVLPVISEYKAIGKAIRASISIPAAKKLLPRFITKQNYTLPEIESELNLNVNQPRINQVRSTPKVKKKLLPQWTETQLDNGLIEQTPLRKGINQEVVKKVVVPGKGDIALKTSVDASGNPVYYFSADVAEGGLSAGKAYKHLEQFIPKGSKILEQKSLSTDSFYNIMQRAKNPKKFTWVNEEQFVPLNNAGKNKLFSNSDKIVPGSTNVKFENFNEAQKALNEFNSRITIEGMPKAKLSKIVDDFQPVENGPWIKKTTFGIDAPNIGLIKEYKQGGIIKDDRGQWNHPGEITRISGGNITMKKDPRTGKALTEPLLGIADTGEQQWMYPGEDYNFEGASYVTEIPKRKLAKNGLRQEQKGLVNLDQLTNFTNYNTKQPGGWLDNL